MQARTHNHFYEAVPAARSYFDLCGSTSRRELGSDTWTSKLLQCISLNLLHDYLHIQRGNLDPTPLFSSSACVLVDLPLLHTQIRRYITPVPRLCVQTSIVLALIQCTGLAKNRHLKSQMACCLLRISIKKPKTNFFPSFHFQEILCTTLTASLLRVASNYEMDSK